MIKFIVCLFLLLNAEFSHAQFAGINNRKVFAPVTGTVTHIQSCNAVSGSSGTTLSCVFSASITAGNLIYACINNATAPTTWSDSGIFILDLLYISSPNIVCYYSVNAGGGSATLTATEASPGYFFSAITADEFHCAPQCVLDVSDYPTPGMATGTSLTPTSSTITPKNPGDLVIGYSSAGLSNNPVYTAGSGFTLGGAQNTGYASSANEYILSSTGPIAATFTLTSSQVWYTHVTSFKP